MEPAQCLADDRAHRLVVGACLDEVECERIVLVPEHDVVLAWEVAEEGAGGDGGGGDLLHRRLCAFSVNRRRGPRLDHEPGPAWLALARRYFDPTVGADA